MSSLNNLGNDFLNRSAYINTKNESAEEIPLTSVASVSESAYVKKSQPPMLAIPAAIIKIKPFLKFTISLTIDFPDLGMIKRDSVLSPIKQIPKQTLLPNQYYQIHIYIKQFARKKEKKKSKPRKMICLT